MGLREYQRKRDFRKTPEPAARVASARRARLRYVIQKHDATRLHYDFRLELDGVLKSWAVPKGPSLDPADKRLAVQVEDHPLEYGSFEGTIPKGQYGGGTVLLWDRGTWEPDPPSDAAKDLRAGRLKFTLKGKKLQGRWMLVRMGGRAAQEGKPNWLLVKERDKFAATGADVLKDEPLSVATGRDLSAIAQGKVGRKKSKTPRKAVWNSTPRSKTPQLAGAVRAGLPRVLHPQLAKPVDHVPEDEGWFHEVKFDGYRVLAFRQGGKVRLITRKGKDWTHRFPEVRDALESRRMPDGVLDGELVALNERGLSDFQSLQNALKEERTGGLVFFVFDVPYWDGWDLRGCTLGDRSALLEKVIRNASTGRIRLSEHIRGKGAVVMQQACRHHLEGIISKRIDSTYAGSRSGTWVKTKCGNRQEFVIGGYTEPRRSRVGFGSLLLGYFDPEGDFVYAGRCGAGFDGEELDRVMRKLKKLEVRECPYAVTPPRADTGKAHWVRPQMVAEIAFTEWTRDGRLRHPVYQGEREDKPAKEVVRETVPPRARVETLRRAATPARVAVRRAANREAEGAGGVGGVGGVRISHPDREVFPGITKADVAAYYERMGEWMMPHVKGRAVSIVRCPSGGNGPCFFQKHLEWGELPGLTSTPIEDSKGEQEYLVVERPVGLVSLVQMNCLEVHAWGAPADDPQQADRLVMDLDPGEGVTWALLVETAQVVRKALAAGGKLKSFVKTTGGKGIHVVAPLSPRVDWDVLKPFARSLAERLSGEDPEHLTSVMAKAKRPGKIFIDYLRNGRGATAVAAYSTRARGTGTVSMPVRWEELAKVKPGDFTIKTAPGIVARRKDPWEGMGKLRQTVKG